MKLSFELPVMPGVNFTRSLMLSRCVSRTNVPGERGHGKWHFLNRLGAPLRHHDDFLNRVGAIGTHARSSP